MRKIKNLVGIVFVGLLTSCITTAKFPISELTPAADITVRTQKQGKPNYQITITAMNLASSQRLNPSRNYYVIWAVSAEGSTRNVGHFTQKNGVKSTYKASFPYKPVEIFITAEDDEGICQPSRMEITRVRTFNK